MSCDTLWQVSGLVTALPQQAKNESPAQHQHAMTAKSLLQGVYTQFAPDLVEQVRRFIAAEAPFSSSSASPGACSIKATADSTATRTVPVQAPGIEPMTISPFLTRPLILTGESGSGKSSFMADLFLNHLPNKEGKQDQANKEDGTSSVTILHFVGSSAESTALPASLQRLARETLAALQPFLREDFDLPVIDR